MTEIKSYEISLPYPQPSYGIEIELEENRFFEPPLYPERTEGAYDRKDLPLSAYLGEIVMVSVQEPHIADEFGIKAARQMRDAETTEDRLEILADLQRQRIKERVDAEHLKTMLDLDLVRMRANDDIDVMRKASEAKT